MGEYNIMRQRDVVKQAKIICNYYGITSEETPLILYGKNATNFYVNYLKNEGFSPSKIKKKVRSANGIFLYENTDSDYIEEKLSKYMMENNLEQDCFKNGVVCMFNLKISTLAHEIRHSYQFNSYMKRYMMLEENEALKDIYRRTYVYYPSEQDAFLEALNYLNYTGNKLDIFMYTLRIAELEIIYFIKNRNECKFTTGITYNTTIVKPFLNYLKDLQVRFDSLRSGNL